MKSFYRITNYYSQDEFLSAIASADSYTKRSAWVDENIK
ncbi:MAG: hypothetical protein FD159_201 [Syntrophaceae bacterium]|nr:MAG: hypothetical protein FD159_201 [Syntrophaceae bacterium]